MCYYNSNKHTEPSQFNCSNYPCDWVLWANKARPAINIINTLYLILHQVYFQQVLPIFFTLLCFSVTQVSFSTAATQKIPDVACSGMKLWEHIIYGTAWSLSLKKKKRYCRADLTLYEETMSKDSSSVFHHKRRTFFFYPLLPLLCQIHIPKYHHTSTSPTLSSLLLPPLSVLSLITESGKPFSLPSINIPAYSELCHKSEW